MANQKVQETDISSANFVRWGMFVIGATLISLSLLLKWQPSLLPRGTDSAIDVSARVGLICLASWLAWPVFAALRRAPGGILLIVGVFFTAIMFTIRKQSIYILGPYMAIAIIAAIILGWIRKNKK
ncbi:MAG: hypothetical protein MUC43_08045 [Pirellula sp.]|jgi:hypothetical protein|nr:hypothetical protein [Pirellula sp.]